MAPCGAPDDREPVRHGVERGAGGDLDPAGRRAGRDDDHVELRPDLVHRRPGERAPPGDPPGDPEPLRETLELLLRGPRPDDRDGPAADQLHGRAEQQVEPLLRDQATYEPDRKSGMRCALDRQRERHAELGNGAVRQRGMAAQRQPSRDLVDRDQSRGAGQRTIPAHRGERAARHTQTFAGEQDIRNLSRRAARASAAAPLLQGSSSIWSSSGLKSVSTPRTVLPCQNGSAVGSALPRMGTGTVRTPASSPQVVCWCCTSPAGTHGPAPRPRR